MISWHVHFAAHWWIVLMAAIAAVLASLAWPFQVSLY